ncbi:SDR family oxidoreductase [Quadrisphaera sp. DSM 44207]|uniref:SDR family oxidoreductase n=1 Tax=Quadrisphaera sp. DSM 44207 TaxID=1881057 RepID=UPI00088CB418|nr:SDR family oxidoreductase [Quadrisphaera sp. DSM 44207]SDQ87968.1 hypothetical protein SAMN05428996_3003 [Quadrisphaera sp. DSM 44207]
MSQDQTTPQDPTSQYAQADDLETQKIDHPGLESDMRSAPDYGEETYRGSGRLEGRRALITGGDSGIGRAVALAFAREGADVAIVYLPEEEQDAQETARVVREAGREIVTLPGDLREESFCSEVVERTVAELGGLDVLVSNAAYQMAVEGIEDLSTEQLLRTYTTNVFATFWLVKAAVRHLQPGSSIIITTSVQAYQPSPSLLDYASTKGALVNLTKGLAQELAPKGIRVNTVAPGPIWTPLIPATMPEEQVESFGAQSPLGRPGQPAELAPAYVFFASQESSYITGDRLGVTGGQPLP